MAARFISPGLVTLESASFGVGPSLRPHPLPRPGQAPGSADTPCLPGAFLFVMLFGLGSGLTSIVGGALAAGTLRAIRLWRASWMGKRGASDNV